MLVLINLESAVDRRASMQRQLARFGLSSERIGIDLRSATVAEFEAQVHHAFPRVKFDRKVLSNAEIGCWISHVTAWRRLLESDCLTATVLEDDLLLQSGFAEAVQTLATRNPARDGFDLIYFGTSSRNISRRRRTNIHGLAIHEPVGTILNTWAYNISRAYAEALLSRDPWTIAQPIDHFLGNGVTSGACAGVLQPMLAIENPVHGAASQIGPYTRRLDRSKFFDGLRRRLLSSALSEVYYSIYRWL
jgi:glycosyl transferase family 25